MPDDAPEAREEGPDDAPITADPVVAAVLERFGDCACIESHGQSVVHVPRAQWADVAQYLRDEHDFVMLLDVCAIDHLLDQVRAPLPAGVAPERFEVVVHLISHALARRIRLICQVPAADATVASLTPVYPAANLGERETFDLFGIVFDGHPELTRILMPDDWEGFPLRKNDAPGRVPVTFKGDPAPR